MYRYLKVKGVIHAHGEGAPLVHNPHAVSNQHYVGMERVPDAGPGRDAHTHFRPVEQVIQDHHDLRKAIAAADLVLVAECLAKTHAEAVQKLGSGKDS